MRRPLDFSIRSLQHPLDQLLTWALVRTRLVSSSRPCRAMNTRLGSLINNDLARDGCRRRTTKNALSWGERDLFETEVIRCQGPWRNRDAVEMATLEWVDWYNNRRLLEALDDIPPAEAESVYYSTMTPSESPRMAEQTLH